MVHLNLERLRAAKVENDPYEYVIVPGFLSMESLRRINDTYPRIERGGSFPIESLEPGTIGRRRNNTLGPQFFGLSVKKPLEY